jgi:hypothetical protein
LGKKDDLVSPTTFGASKQLGDQTVTRTLSRQTRATMIQGFVTLREVHWSNIRESTPSGGYRPTAPGPKGTPVATLNSPFGAPVVPLKKPSRTPEPRNRVDNMKGIGDGSNRHRGKQQQQQQYGATRVFFFSLGASWFADLKR